MLALHDLHEGIWVLKAFKPQWQHPCSDWYLSLFVRQTGLKEPFQKSVPLIKQAKHATCFSSLQQPENIGWQTSILLSHRICAMQISSRSLAPGLCTGYNARWSQMRINEEAACFRLSSMHSPLQPMPSDWLPWEFAKHLVSATSYFHTSVCISEFLACSTFVISTCITHGSHD